MNIPKMETGLVAGKMPVIHFHFVRVYVIGPDDFPSGLFQTHAHEPDAREKFRNRKFVFHCFQPSAGDFNPKTTMQNSTKFLIHFNL